VLPAFAILTCRTDDVMRSETLTIDVNHYPTIEPVHDIRFQRGWQGTGGRERQGLGGRGGGFPKALGTKKAPGLRRGLMLVQQGSAYRLAWRLAPPLAPAAWLPRTSPEETSLTQSELLPL
jgi:hypothetical protein